MAPISQCLSVSCRSATCSAVKSRAWTRALVPSTSLFPLLLSFLTKGALTEGHFPFQSSGIFQQRFLWDSQIFRHLLRFPAMCRSRCAFLRQECAIMMQEYAFFQRTYTVLQTTQKHFSALSWNGEWHPVFANTSLMNSQ